MEGVISFCKDANTLAQTMGKQLNYPGYIPVVSCVTGLVRHVAGDLQMTVGLFECGVGGAAAAAGYFTNSQQLFQQGIQVAKLGAEFAIDGLFNGWRGAVELIPFVGNGLCFWYDIVRGGQPLVFKF